MAISLPIVSSFDKRGLENAKRALSSFAGFAADVGKAAAAAVAGVAVASVREATQFETSFAQIEGLVGLSTEEVEKLQAAARELAPEFGKSANEAADALFFITSAGLRGADAIDVLEASLKASTAGLGDVNSIANTATAAMNTYGSEVLSGSDAVAALTEAVRLGQFAPEELASALGRVVPISAELGVSFEETTGLIASLTKGGLSASEAVTGIRGAMQAVLKPSGEAADMLEKYGFTTEEVRDSIERDGLLATFENLREAFGENEEDFTRVIGSIEGLNAVLALTGENNEAYREIVQLMTDDVQILDEAFNTVADTAQFKFDEAMSRTKDTLLGIGQDLLERINPYLEDFATFMEQNGPVIEEAFDGIFQVVDDVAGSIEQFITDLVQNENFQTFLANLQTWFDETWPIVKSLIDEVAELAITLTPLLTGAIETALPVIQDLVSIFDDLAFFINEGTENMSGMQVELPKLSELAILQLNPIGQLARAFERLAAALRSAREQYEKWKSSRDPARQAQEQETSGIRSIGGARAMGGLVTGGSMYAVGERGPELFVPAENGSIIPNNQLGGTNYYVTVNAGMGTNGAQVGEQIVAAIKRYERSSGKVFASA